jgi:tetratricopeptide (TPR) repeat protein
MRLGRTQEGQQELEVFRRLQIEAATARSRQIKLEGIKGAAVLSSAAGDNEKAVALLREALTYEPEAAFSHMDLGRALIKAGQIAEAIEHFKSAVALNAHFDVHRDLADAYAALGRLDESRQEHALYERLRQESLRSAGANR